MKTPVLIAALAVLPALAACQPAKPITRLDCPQTSGQLTRVSAAADGRSCLYSGAGGLQMSMALTKVASSPAAALEPIEADLRKKAGAAAQGPIVANTAVDLPGLHVRANGEDEQAEIKVGPMTIQADDGGAEVRSSRDVRLKGQSLSPARNGHRASFMLAGDQVKNGYRAVGYEAAGPRTGPLVVASFTATTDAIDHLDLKEDIEHLVRENAGL